MSRRINVRQFGDAIKIVDGGITNLRKDSSGYLVELSRDDMGFVQPLLGKVSDRDAWTFYRFNEWLNSIIDRIISDCVKVDVKVVAKDKKSELSKRLQERIRVIERFLDDPNKNKESFKEIREKAIRDLLVYGRAAIEKVLEDKDGAKGEFRRLLEIYVLISKNVVINADNRGNLKQTDTYGLIDPKTGKIDSSAKFDIDEIIFMVLKPTSATLYGMKPIDAIASTVAADILRSIYNLNFFVNNGETSGILSLEGAGKKEVRKFRQMWEAKFKGATNSHKLAIVNNVAKFTRMALTNRDMEFGTYGVELFQKMMAVYKMQPIIMGFIDASTGKLNSSQQIQLYKDGALRPILDRESFYYTNEIVKDGFGFTDVKIEFSGLDLLDLEMQSEIDRKDVQNAIITVNEVRTRRGLNPVKWGDAPVIILPGGGQIDPDTGRIINPKADNGGSSNKTPKKNQTVSRKKLETYIASVKLQSKILCGCYHPNGEFDGINLEDKTKSKQIHVGGNPYIVKHCTFPVDLKTKKIYELITMITDYENHVNKSDERSKYMDCLASRLKYVILDVLQKGTIEELPNKIDSIASEELNSEFVSELF